MLYACKHAAHHLLSHVQETIQKTMHNFRRPEIDLIIIQCSKRTMHFIPRE